MSQPIQSSSSHDNTSFQHTEQGQGERCEASYIPDTFELRREATAIHV